MPAEDAALVDLLRALGARGYAFVTPTPATHARVIARPDRRQARDLAGVFGWSLPFEPRLVDAELLDLMRAGGVLAQREDGLLAARVRASTVRGLLFLHSAFPTEDEDAVFLGPDSWRFADFAAAEIAAGPPPRRLVDVGAGAGVGALTAAAAAPGARLTATDVNAEALRLARINAAAAGLELETVETDSLGGVEGAIDLVMANPPYVVDAESRTYRDGGDLYGGRISVEMARFAVERLERGGRLLLYTGAAVLDGRSPLLDALEPAMAEAGCDLRWREIDPDVFGEELDRPEYADVERIAVIGAVAVKQS